jgi:hypothetical protein
LEHVLLSSIQLRELCAVPTLPGFTLVRKAVANDGSLLFLFAETWTAEALSATYTQGIGTFPRTRAERKARLCLTRLTSGTSHTVELPKLDLTFPIVDVFPDGRVLVAGPRCSWRTADDFDLNGTVVETQTGKVANIIG